MEEDNRKHSRRARFWAKFKARLKKGGLSTSKFNAVYLLLTLFSISFTYYTWKTNLRPPPMAQLAYDFDDRISISQYWGSIVVSHNLQITNGGDAMGSLASITGVIVSLDKGRPFEQKVRANNFSDNNYNQRILAINIAAKAWWDGTFGLYKDMDDQENDIISALQDSVESDRRNFKSGFKISPSTSKAINDFVIPRLNQFTSGNYAYLLFYNGFDGLTTYRTFKFRISEINVKILRDAPFKAFEGKQRFVTLHLFDLDKKTSEKLVHKYLIPVENGKK